MIYGELRHQIHPSHKLKLEFKQSLYICDGCHEEGLGSRYTCVEDCEVHLHKHCAEPRPRLRHPFFPDCNFVFLESMPRRICDACNQNIKGYLYHCDGYDKDLHPCCANLPPFMDEGVQLQLKRKTPHKCNKCGMKDIIKGRRCWSYVSPGNEYHLHVSCAKQMIRESWERELVRHATGDGKELDIWTPNLQIVIPEGKKRKGKFKKLSTVAKIAIAFITAAVLGDPTSIVVGLIASLIPH